MNAAIEHGIAAFQELLGDDRDASLRSIVVAFPDLEQEAWHLVDEGHRASKPKAVEKGLMLGQFHPSCDAPAALNPGFPVNRAPIPLIVIRQMAPHDILFLKDPIWLEHYKATMAKRGIPVEHLVRHTSRLCGRDV